ncbi:MAG: alpha-1,2-fucosyltransferase [Lutibacter sp.]|nr:alpha-1,2-fucosyltransferase [Lutibacter sp.]
MIYSNIYGGLGNQMFQYAIAKNISILNNVCFKLDVAKMNNSYLRDYSLKKFNISNVIASLEEVKKFHKNKYYNYILRELQQKNILLGNKYYEKLELIFDKKVLSLQSGYLEGYWQSFKYFENIRDVLLKDFTLAEEMNFENKLIYNEIISTNSISIHIRRGDYISNSKNNKIYNVFGLEYYNKAIDFITKQINNPYFYVFSDDLEWASKYLNLSNVTYVGINSSKNPENDLVLMSYCKHNIIANSTFSWWAAWLNQNQNKIIIAPKKWMSTVNNLDDLYPQTWIRM